MLLLRFLSFQAAAVATVVAGEIGTNACVVPTVVVAVAKNADKAILRSTYLLLRLPRERTVDDAVVAVEAAIVVSDAGTVLLVSIVSDPAGWDVICDTVCD